MGTVTDLRQRHCSPQSFFGFTVNQLQPLSAQQGEFCLQEITPLFLCHAFVVKHQQIMFCSLILTTSFSTVMLSPNKPNMFLAALGKWNSGQALSYFRWADRSCTDAMRSHLPDPVPHCLHSNVGIIPPEIIKNSQNRSCAAVGRGPVSLSTLLMGVCCPTSDVWFFTFLLSHSDAPLMHVSGVEIPGSRRGDFLSQ